MRRGQRRGGLGIHSTPREPDAPRVLIVEQSPAVAIDVIHALRSDRPPTSHPRSVVELLRDHPVEALGHLVLGTLHELHEQPLEEFDVVITASSLPDGSGLDVLAYLRGVRPQLPVILSGSQSDASMATEAIQSGALDFIVTSPETLHALPLVLDKALVHQRIKDENDRLRREVGRSLAQLEVKNRELRQMIEQLETMARTDGLTGLANRRWLNLMLTGHWADATRHDLPMAFLMIDLDGFKMINDRQGHQKGDELLRLAARVLHANCRDVDIPARFGGDEFCVLMCHTTPEQAVHVAQRLRHEFELSTADRTGPTVSMSIGVAHVNVSRPINAEQLVTHADQALYAAKMAGKNRIMVRGREGSAAPDEVLEHQKGTN